jgi:hypothetical protein
MYWRYSSGRPADDVALHRGATEAEDDLLHHLRRVGVELLGVIHHDPGVVQALDRLA